MKKLKLSLILGFVFTLVISFVFLNGKEVEDLTNRVLRLHILANSDDDFDQALKLEVRDKVLEETREIFESSENKSDAISALSQKLDEIESVAKSVVLENGYDYDVSCEIVRMDFEKREYEDFTMPEGTYDALRIYIGEAEGKNWWCVMFPPLCISNAIEITEDEYFSDSEIVVLKKPEQVRYKLVCYDIFLKVKKFFKSL